MLAPATTPLLCWMIFQRLRQSTSTTGSQEAFFTPHQFHHSTLWGPNKWPLQGTMHHPIGAPSPLVGVDSDASGWHPAHPQAVPPKSKHSAQKVQALIKKCWLMTKSALQRCQPTKGNAGRNYCTWRGKRGHATLADRQRDKRQTYGRENTRDNHTDRQMERGRSDKKHNANMRTTFNLYEFSSLLLTLLVSMGV